MSATPSVILVISPSKVELLGFVGLKAPPVDSMAGCKPTSLFSRL